MIIGSCKACGARVFLSQCEHAIYAACEGCGTVMELRPAQVFWDWREERPVEKRQMVGFCKFCGSRVYAKERSRNTFEGLAEYMRGIRYHVQCSHCAIDSYAKEEALEDPSASAFWRKK